MQYDLYKLGMTDGAEPSGASFIDLGSDSDKSMERMLDKYFYSDKEI